jgi:hypothetical protein
MQIQYNIFLQIFLLGDSVADPDQGSGAFLTHGYGIRDTGFGIRDG